jgi:hypothetical protein
MASLLILNIYFENIHNFWSEEISIIVLVCQINYIQMCKGKALFIESRSGPDVLMTKRCEKINSTLLNYLIFNIFLLGPKL